MNTGHFYSAGAYIDHGDASVLLPVDSLTVDVMKYRDAELKLEDVQNDEVVAVSPTGFASSYSLTQHPLSVVKISDLSPDIRETLDERVDIDLDSYQYIQIGRGSTQSENHSLREY